MRNASQLNTLFPENTEAESWPIWRRGRGTWWVPLVTQGVSLVGAERLELPTSFL